VEDDKPLLEFFLTVLRRDGYTVFTADNGLAALEIAKEHQEERIDILFTDVAMPYMSGIQLASNLKEARPDIQVLLTSALPEQEISDRCGPNNQMEFLAKPFTVLNLSAKIRSSASQSIGD
jgi:CheY-like chemotaxis protein